MKAVAGLKAWGRQPQEETIMVNQRHTPAGRQQCEMMRDEAANDNMSTDDRRAMMDWAQVRMRYPAWREVAVAAMVQAQR